MASSGSAGGGERQAGLSAPSPLDRREGHFAVTYTFGPLMPFRGVPGLVQRDGHQQPPEVIPVVKLEVAPLLPSTDARINALQQILGTDLLADSPSEMPAGEGQQLAEVMLPEQPGGLVTLPRVVRPQQMDHLCDGTGEFHCDTILAETQTTHDSREPPRDIRTAPPSDRSSSPSEDPTSPSGISAGSTPRLYGPAETSRKTSSQCRIRGAHS